jgi:hypothetical protein
VIVWDVLSSLGLMNKASTTKEDAVELGLTLSLQHAKLLFLGLYASSPSSKLEGT